MAIINFSSVIQSYAKYENVIGTQKLAKIKNCPHWIIKCRHALCHLSPTPPTFQLLSNCVSFCFKWMAENFFQKMINEECIIDKKFFSELSNHTCNILFNNLLTRKQLLNLTKSMENYIALNSNNYIGIFVDILLMELPKHWCDKVKVTFDDRASLIFNIIFSFDPGHSLILLLNCIVDKLIHLQNDSYTAISNYEAILKSIYFGHFWLRKILINCFYLNEEKLRNSFSHLPNRLKLKSDFQFQWKRLFYKILKIEPHQLLIDSITVICFFIDEVENESKINQIIQIMEIYLNNSNLILTNGNNEDKTIKRIEDIPQSGIFIFV